MRVLVAACALALVLIGGSCGGLGLAINAGAIPPPALHVQFGQHRLVAFTTNTASCARSLLCPPNHIKLRSGGFYAVWLMSPSHGATSRRANGRALLVLPFQRRATRS